MRRRVRCSAALNMTESDRDASMMSDEFTAMALRMRCVLQQLLGCSNRMSRAKLYTLLDDMPKAKLGVPCLEDIGFGS